MNADLAVNEGLIALGVSFVLCFLLVPVFLGLARVVGIYVVVRERHCNRIFQTRPLRRYEHHGQGWVMRAMTAMTAMTAIARACHPTSISRR